MTEWFRIDDPDNPPPKDGRTILAVSTKVGKRGYTLIFWDDMHEEWAGYTSAHEAALVKHQPTHWVPLPERPE
jgi:hypothetical protein